PYLRRRLTMIMSGRSAKNLNWAGALGLACLGLALLPVPVRAQQTTPGSVVPIQLQPAKKTPMSLDVQIEALRRVLQQLEEQKRKEQGQPAEKTSPKDAKTEQKVLTPAEAIQQRPKEKVTVQFKVIAAQTFQ